MMRSFTHAYTTLLALLAALACAGVLAAGRTRRTGGAAGAAAAPAPPATPAARSTRPAIATWFGPGFYGQKTACGQTLTPAVVGVANRTLPVRHARARSATRATR